MALFPWEQCTLIEFSECEHCGAPQEFNSHSKQVIVCSCPGAQQAELAERERRATWQREQNAQQRGRKAKLT